jgi:hypothetical protein
MLACGSFSESNFETVLCNNPPDDGSRSGFGLSPGGIGPGAIARRGDLSISLPELPPFAKGKR